LFFAPHARLFSQFCEVIALVIIPGGLSRIWLKSERNVKKFEVRREVIVF
jgi:hypothetical protein